MLLAYPAEEYEVIIVKEFRKKVYRLRRGVQVPKYPTDLSTLSQTLHAKRDHHGDNCGHSAADSIGKFSI